MADLTDQNPLFFVISDFRNAQINGEWNISFGHHVEAGVGIGYIPAVRDEHVPESRERRRVGNPARTAAADRADHRCGAVHAVGRQGDVQPYVGVGIGAFLYRYSEAGQFVDPSDFSVFTDAFTKSGTTVGPFQ